MHDPNSLRTSTHFDYLLTSSKLGQHSSLRTSEHAHPELFHIQSETRQLNELKRTKDFQLPTCQGDPINHCGHLRQPEVSENPRWLLVRSWWPSLIQISHVHVAQGERLEDQFFSMKYTSNNIQEIGFCFFFHFTLFWLLAPIRPLIHQWIFSPFYFPAMFCLLSCCGKLYLQPCNHIDSLPSADQTQASWNHLGISSFPLNILGLWNRNVLWLVISLLLFKSSLRGLQQRKPHLRVLYDFFFFNAIYPRGPILPLFLGAAEPCCQTTSALPENEAKRRRQREMKLQRGRDGGQGGCSRVRRQDCSRGRKEGKKGGKNRGTKATQ